MYDVEMNFMCILWFHLQNIHYADAITAKSQSIQNAKTFGSKPL